MKKMLCVGFCVLLASFNLVGCQPGENTGGATVVGATAGGLLGAAAFGGSGQWVGILGGALVGGMIGNQIGQYMDRQDRANMQRAITTTPVGQQASWTNPKRDITYRVTPVKSYHRHHRYCREYQTEVTIAGKLQKAYGKACRMPDGQWRLVK